MALTAFTRRLGTGQGRLPTPHATLGEHAFVLGNDEPGWSHNLAIGDHAEVIQHTDLTDVALVRAKLRLRVPESTSTSSGPSWEASIVVDGIKYARTTAASGRERLITDLAANVSKLTGVHSVGVRLELVSQ